MNTDRYNEKILLLKEVCNESFIRFNPSGGVKTKSPEGTLKHITTDLISLNNFIKEQRGFESRNCGHILCGDTRNSCVIIGLALRLFQPSTVYEIGRYRGWSTAQIAFNLKRNFELHGSKSDFVSIDPHCGAKGGDGWVEDQCGGSNEWDISKDNLVKSGIEKFVTPVRAYSLDYIEDVKKNVEFVFVDGDHTYSGAKQDVKQYGNKMISGGICILHDVWGEKFGGDNYGPSLVYAEADQAIWEKVGNTWDVGILRRK